MHWVGNAGSTALANRNYFENLKNTHKTSASSHYIIGLEGEIVRCIPENEVAFHSGSYSMNRQSIGIENCHPDWEGKFSDDTYNSLVELCADICNRYELDVESSIIRHYDVTGKNCPKYYVENEAEWNKFKRDVANKCEQEINTEIEENNNKESEEEMTIYKNGSTRETIYADTDLTKIIGYLAPYEQCDCYGIFEGRPIVRYKIDGSNNYKIGFAVWTGGVQ